MARTSQFFLQISKYKPGRIRANKTMQRTLKKGFGVSNAMGRYGRDWTYPELLGYALDDRVRFNDSGQVGSHGAVWFEHCDITSSA